MKLRSWNRVREPYQNSRTEYSFIHSFIHSPLHLLMQYLFNSNRQRLEKEMAIHSGILARRIPGTEEPGGLLSMGSHSIRHNWSDLAAAAAIGKHGAETRERHGCGFAELMLSGGHLTKCVRPKLMFLLSSDSHCRRVMLGIIYVKNIGTKIPVAAKLFLSFSCYLRS